MIARNVVCLPRRNHRNRLPVVSVVCRHFCPSSNISHQFRLPLCFHGACMKCRSLTKNFEARIFVYFFYCVPAEAVHGVNNRETNEKHDIWKIIIVLVIYFSLPGCYCVFCVILNIIIISLLFLLMLLVVLEVVIFFN